MRIRHGAALAAAVAIAGCTAAGPEDHSVATFELRDLEPEEAAFLDIINDYRADHGLGSLTASRSINQAAYDHSLDMGTQHYFDHYSLDGRSPWDRMCAAGYEPACTGSAMMGENIAAGNESAWDTFVQWRESPPHNENMLTPEFTCIGIGRAYVGGSPYGYYWTTDFSSVIDDPVCECTGSETRPCSNGPCTGVEACDGCTWGECSAPAPADEVCDGADNDCDTLVDEDDVCASCTPTEEVCDGADNDCDTLVDEDGVCAGCTPTEEVCDGADNDCDTLVDEDGVCDCVPAEEACDGADNDCDDLVDEDGVCGVEGTEPVVMTSGCSCSMAAGRSAGGAAAALIMLLAALLVMPWRRAGTRRDREVAS